MSQRSAPVLEALAAVQRRPLIGFGAPGHGMGRAATPDVVRLLGRRAFEADVLTPKGLDDRLERGQVLQHAHALAAKAWGADLCRFSTGGSTQSLHTALSAVARPGETVLVAQNAHKAEYATAIFAGLDLQPLPATIDRDWDVEHGVTAAALEAAFAAHPQARAALVVSPTYFGVTSDIEALAKVCHARGKPLIVDAAWGAAYGFCKQLPQNPIRQGADLVVASVHKTMAALAQGSVMLQSGDRVDPERLALAYELFETTSPSVAIFASLDATRREHALHGQAVWSRVVRRARRLRTRLGALPGLRVMGRERLDGRSAFDLDETKITLDVSGLGLTGYEADDWLKRRHDVSVGLSDATHLLAIINVGTSRADARALVQALSHLVERRRGRPPTDAARAIASAPRLADLGLEIAMPPAEAFAAPAELVPLGEAAGRICAEVIAPAPPGVPRLIPGQRITPSHQVFLQAHDKAGVLILDPADPEQKRVRVVKAQGRES